MKTYPTQEEIHKAKVQLNRFAMDCSNGTVSFEDFQNAALNDKEFIEVFGKTALRRIVNTYAPNFK